MSLEGSGFPGTEALNSGTPKRIRHLNLGRFQVGSYRYRSLIEGLYTLNSPPVNSLNPKP